MERKCERSRLVRFRMVCEARLSVAEMEKKAGLGSFKVLNGEMVLLANVGCDKQF